jgi:hypothetical protein
MGYPIFGRPKKAKMLICIAYYMQFKYLGLVVTTQLSKVFIIFPKFMDSSFPVLVIE